MYTLSLLYLLHHLNENTVKPEILVGIKLVVEPKISIARILTDLNLVVGTGSPYII